jgi:ATP-dependent Clp protease adaptor protein ClpS
MSVRSAVLALEPEGPLMGRAYAPFCRRACACHHGHMSAPLSSPTTQVDPALDEDVAGATPWQAVVWNDPVNLMSYVTYVLQKIFGYPEPKATALMLDVHHKGKAAVSSGDKDKIEGDVAKLHAAGLWATMQRT